MQQETLVTSNSKLDELNIQFDDKEEVTSKKSDPLFVPSKASFEDLNLPFEPFEQKKPSVTNSSVDVVLSDFVLPADNVVIKKQETVKFLDNSVKTESIEYGDLAPSERLVAITGKVKTNLPKIENTLINPDFLNILFNSDEEISVSPNKYATQSMPIEALKQPYVTIVSNSNKVPDQTVSIEDLVLVSLNPVKGKRLDKNCTMLRTFLVEVDTMSIADQKKYIKSIDLPYSVCVFSGGKSLHYAVVLEDGITGVANYNFYAKWILNIASKADQNTINPSRCIRIPDANRVLEDGTVVKQKLIDLKERITLDDLDFWLSKHPECRPKKHTKKMDLTGGVANIQWVPKRFKEKINNGINSFTSRQRNKDWFACACEFAKYNFTYDMIVEMFEHHFEEEPDFKRSEWLAALQSGVNYMKSKKDE